jgi:hypothetical protein
MRFSGNWRRARCDKDVVSTHEYDKPALRIVQIQNAPCKGTGGFAIVRVLLLRHTKIEQIERVAEKEEVDELSETLHNLASLLLTNTTIRKRSKAVPNTVL